MTVPAFGLAAAFTDPESDRVVTALAEGVLGVASARVHVGKDLA